MKRYVLITTALLLILSMNTAWGQIKRDKFLNNYIKLISGATSDRVPLEFVEKELGPLLMVGNQFPEDVFQRMSQNIDLLIENHHKVYPDTYNYVTAVYSFIKKGKLDNNYTTWHAFVDDLMKNRNPKKIETFLSETSDFLFRNIIINDQNFKWFCIGGDFELINKKNEPFINFTNTTLICKTINRGTSKNKEPYSDSIKVTQTNGELDMGKRKWKGNNGTINWEKVGLPKDQTYATFINYQISLRSTNLTADSVTLTTSFVNKKMYGKLTDRAVKGAVGKEGDLPYPQFFSYEANFEIKNIVQDIDYRGGFSLEGSDFVGIGNSKTPAQLTYMRKGAPFIKTKSDRVIINPKKILTPMASFVLYFGNGDSITHTGLNISYEKESDKVLFSRGSSTLSQSPFVDSYHKMDLYVDEIAWSRNSSELILAYDKAGSDQKRKARFESFNYYDEQLYQRLQGMESINPLNALYNYAYKYDKFDMTEGVAATALNRTIEQAKSLLIELSTLGFITYNSEKGIVTILDKTEHFVKSRSNKSDYDNISFTSNLSPTRIDAQAMSTQEQQNAQKKNQERTKINEYGKIDLSSLDMSVSAVDFINISTSKNTTIFPNNYEVTIKKNRNIVFTGWINSGKWEIKISQGNYSYEDNKFNIFDSDIALFTVNPFRKEDGDQKIPLQSSITGLKGELKIDDVLNRSGNKKEFYNYPILVSKEKTKVFYDQKQLYLGAYDKERFYFEIAPFTVDSLNSFSEKAIRFSGELVSAGIFPKIKDDLKIMADYSLGFSRESPKEGYQFYGTDAKYDNKILLSNNGLQGAGTINFLNSTSTSKRLFTFLPDSTVGIASFINRPQESGIQYPDAEGADVLISYNPRKKTLKARSAGEPIVFYNKETKFTGTAIIRETGMKGQGILALQGAEMSSDNFKFSRWKASADTSNFILRNSYINEEEKEDPLAFKSTNLNGNIDFKERKGVFKSNAGESTVEFPVNKYICKIDQFTWLMDRDELTLESKKHAQDINIEGDLDLVGPNFFSIHPKQDSLQFRSAKANYSLKEKTIYCNQVEFIEVADARIYPDSQKVVIHKNAQMESFSNANIVANFITKYHSITNVNATITARRAYKASGDYLYGTEDSEKQLIHLTEIRPDSSYQTVAKGTIEKDENFKLSKHFDFYGKISLKAANPFLVFNGATKVNHECDKFERNWMSFKTEIDPNNIQIPVAEKLSDLEGNPISVGILWRESRNTDSVSLYPTFLSSVNGIKDPVVITASGFLQYNESAEEYQIGSKEKLINRAEKGNFIALHTPTCSMNGDGKISLGMDLDQFQTEAVGVINYNHSTDQTDMNITLAIKAPLDDKTFKDLAVKIKNVDGLKDADFASTTLEQAIATWIDQKTADKIKSDYTLKKEFKTVPKEFKDEIILTGVKLRSFTKSGEQTRGLISTDSEIAIVNIFGEPVMKYIPMKIFTEQRSNFGDRFGMLWDVPGLHSYFYDYDYRKDGIMSIFTDDSEFNEVVINLKPSLKKTNRFIYDITTSSAGKIHFLRVFN
ncbi:MAG: hypothetical protein H3C31_09105 [Brumimicrobium sp.]|nr:hypothetical protein [Brumimicrobium sp.]